MPGRHGSPDECRSRAEAAERWAELVRLVPHDSEAADALERIAERRGDTVELLELLRARAARLPLGHPDRTGALRRIARELGGRQGRRGEVLAALREVHQQNPDDLETAQQLAALARGAGDLLTASEALQRGFQAASVRELRVWFGLESARCSLQLGDHESAARTIRELMDGLEVAAEPRGLEIVRLQLEIALARGDLREEAWARVRLAEIDLHASPVRRASNCSAAARALAALGQHVAARDLAWQAVRAQQGDPVTLALLCELTFIPESGRVPGRPGTLDGELLDVLMRIDPQSAAPPEALASIAFARAELLDERHGGGAGYQDLHRWGEAVRMQPLAQLALAERLSAEWSFGPAAVAYERAFSGDLRGLRPLGPTALRAADSAARSNDAVRARAFLDLAARDPGCRIDARKRAVDLARTLGDEAGALRALERLAAEATGNVRARALTEQARMLKQRDPESALEAMRLALNACEDQELREELERERTEIEGVRVKRSLPPPPPPPSVHDSSATLRREGTLERTVAAALEGSGPQLPRPLSASPPLVERPGGRRRHIQSHWISPQSQSAPPPAEASFASTPLDLDDGHAMAVPSSRTAPESSALPSTATPEPTLDVRLERALEAHQQDPVATNEPDEPPPSQAPAAPMAVAGERPEPPWVSSASAGPEPERREDSLFAMAEAAAARGNQDEALRCWLLALDQGEVEAGNRAAELLMRRDDHVAALLLIRRRQHHLAPGDLQILSELHRVVTQSGDATYARAIEHVRRAFDPQGAIAPPPLEVQLDRPDLIVPLIERRAHAGAAEALRLVWEHAPHVFRRDVSQLDLGMLDRVNTVTPIGRVVVSAAHLLGTTRTPVYFRARRGRDVEAVLLQPPAVILGNDCREDTAHNRYLLGAGLLAALPAHALLLAQPEAAARSIWQALLSAFGPPEHGRGVIGEVGKLAAGLWQAIPRAPQRRLGELLGQAPPSFEAVVEGARQVARRGGLYVAGDLAVAVRSTLTEGSADGNVTITANDLARLCNENEAIADLVRFAASPEYAEARWQVTQNGWRQAQTSNRARVWDNTSRIPSGSR